MATPYKSAEIRKLVDASFDDVDLNTLCFDYFRLVYDKFSAGMDRRKKIQLLIEYCERNGEYPALLNQIKSQNPYQFNKYLSQLSSIQAQQIEPEISAIDERFRETVVATLKIESKILNAETYDAFIEKMKGVLAEELDVPPSKIDIEFLDQTQVLDLLHFGMTGLGVRNE